MHRNTRHSSTRALVAGLVLCAAGTACGPSSEKQAFASERVYEPVGQEVRFGATTAQRFRLDRSEFQMPRAPQGGGGFLEAEVGQGEELEVAVVELPLLLVGEVALVVAGQDGRGLGLGILLDEAAGEAADEAEGAAVPGRG